MSPIVGGVLKPALVKLGEDEEDEKSVSGGDSECVSVAISLQWLIKGEGAGCCSAKMMFTGSHNKKRINSNNSSGRRYDRDRVSYHDVSALYMSALCQPPLFSQLRRQLSAVLGTNAPKYAISTRIKFYCFTGISSSFLIGKNSMAWKICFNSYKS